MIVRFVLYAGANGTETGKALPERRAGAGVRTQGWGDGVIR